MIRWRSICRSLRRTGRTTSRCGSCLTHYSGLEPDLDLKTAWEGKETAYRMAFAETPEDAPGSRFSYSDINFIVLGALVERVSGETLDAVCGAAYFFAAEDDAYAVSASGGVAGRRLLRRSMTRMSTCCGGWCMILRRGGWAAWRGMRGCFLLGMIWRSLPRLC